jgi:hypothetical protein
MDLPRMIREPELVGMLGNHQTYPCHALHGIGTILEATNALLEVQTLYLLEILDELKKQAASG